MNSMRCSIGGMSSICILIDYRNPLYGMIGSRSSIYGLISCRNSSYWPIVCRWSAYQPIDPIRYNSIRDCWRNSRSPSVSPRVLDWIICITLGKILSETRFFFMRDGPIGDRSGIHVLIGCRNLAFGPIDSSSSIYGLIGCRNFMHGSFGGRVLNYGLVNYKNLTHGLIGSRVSISMDWSITGVRGKDRLQKNETWTHRLQEMNRYFTYIWPMNRLAHQFRKRTYAYGYTKTP